MVVFDLRRDTSFMANIENRNVGVNVINLLENSHKQLIVKHLPNFEEELKIEDFGAESK